MGQNQAPKLGSPWRTALSRLNDLLRQLRMENPALADDLQREFDALADRRSFGLNFERHVPEAVELPGRRVRKGDKVRVLPGRGEARTAENDRLWCVTGIAAEDGVRRATVVSLDDAEQEVSAAVDDLVVVAEFRDPIYPGLVSTGKVERGGEKPFHTVINAENFHALQTLLFTHRGKIDTIYIDPPYNTGAKDWKYNNDYVEADDLYRHSKWLAFIERRLLLAKELLNPADSVLIVAIDEKEYVRLGMLLQQTFPDARIQMISTMINPAGGARSDAFGRNDEYLFFLMFGRAAPQRVALPREWVPGKGRTHTGNVRWDLLRRSGHNNAARHDRPALFYPIYIDPDGPRIADVGEPLAPGEHEAPPIDGAVPLLPIRQDGSEGNWQAQPSTLRERIKEGRVRVTGSSERGYTISVLKNGEYQKIVRGEFEVTGHRDDGSLVVDDNDSDRVIIVPSTQWRVTGHDSTQYGTRMLNELLGGRRFPFPKSLYAVEDALRFFVTDEPDAVVLDFFAGSGTTAHAVMRLNKQDGGRRQCISVTNNEVSAEEQRRLRKDQMRPGDPEWEALGICDFITKPRLAAAISGRAPDGDPINGDYKFTDEFPMADGLEENVEFFTLTYEAPLRVASNREFTKVAPLLWLRAGSRGRRIDDISKGWDVADVYGVLADLDETEAFLKAVAENDDVAMAFIVTDEDRLFESLVAALPEHIEPVRLYEAYLRNFEIEAGRGAR
jgi:adenine-specific DNA-methyltransferase